MGCTVFGCRLGLVWSIQLLGGDHIESALAASAIDYARERNQAPENPTAIGFAWWGPASRGDRWGATAGFPLATIRDL